MIEDYDYVLSTDEEISNAYLDTEIINGKLLAVIINSNIDIDIRIVNLDNDIFKMRVVGVKYVPINIVSEDGFNNAMTYNCEKYYLNNRLKLIIENNFKAEVLITLRVDTNA